MFNQTWLRILTFLALGFCTYSFMLGAPFKTLDDQFSIISNPIIHDTKHIKEIFTQGYFKDHTYYRPLVNISYMLEYRLFGLKPFFYNLDNLLLHILNSFGVWGLVFLLTESLSMGFWVGLLFLIHPIHVEAVANISGRAILLSTGFVLMTFSSFLFYLRKGKAIFLVLSVFTFILGILCKESTAVLPGVFFIYLWQKKKSAISLWPYAVIIGGYIFLRHYLGITQTFPWRSVSEHILGIGSFLRSVATDVRLFILPIDLHFDRSQRLFLFLTDPEFLVTMILGALLLIGLWSIRMKIKPMTWFCLGWIAIEFFPVSQIVTTIGVQPGRISTADHFLYVLSIPVFMMGVDAWKNLWQANQIKMWVSEKVLKIGISCFLLVLIVFNIAQNLYSKNDYVMLKRSLEVQPENARLQSSLGLIYVGLQKYNLAEECFRKALLGDLMNTRYQVQLAQSVCDQGRYQECLGIYNQIKDPGMYKAMVINNKEKALRLLNQNVAISSK